MMKLEEPIRGKDAFLTMTKKSILLGFFLTLITGCNTLPLGDLPPTPTLIPTDEVIVEITESPEVSYTATVTKAPTMSPSPAPTVTSSPTLTVTPSPTLTVTPSPIPTVTPSPIPTNPPVETKITIDGKADDWAERPILFEDPAGDAENDFLDLSTGYAFVNQNALYLLVEAVDPNAPFIQFDIQFQAGSKRLLISWKPGDKRGWVGDITSDYKSIGEATHSTFAFETAVEGRIDLRDIGLPDTLKLTGINIMVGECCQFPQWRAADQWQPNADTPRTNEFDPPRLVGADNPALLEKVWPEGIPRMDEFLPTGMEMDKTTRISNIIKFTNQFALPEGYWAERILTPSLPSPLAIAIDGSGNAFVATHHPDAQLVTVDLKTGNITKLFDLQNWGGLVGNDQGEGIWIGMGDSIWYVTPNGEQIRWLSDAGGIPLALGPDGMLYGMSYDGKVLQFTQQGSSPVSDTTFEWSNYSDIAISEDGVLYVSDARNGKIWRLTDAKEFSEVANGFAVGDPIPLRFAPDGTLYVTGTPFPLMQVNSQTGETIPLTWVQGGFSSLHYLFFDAHPQTGILYFVDPSFSHIIEVNPQEQSINMVVRGIGNAKGLRFGLDGNLYFADSSRTPVEPTDIYALRPDGTSQLLTTISPSVLGLDQGTDLRLYASTFNQLTGEAGIVAINTNGEVVSLTHWTDSSYFPGSLDINPITGEIVVFELNSDKLLTIDSSGQQTVLPIQFDAPIFNAYIDHSSTGTLYILAINEEGQFSGPQVIRRLFKSVDDLSLDLIANINHEGCCTTENIAVGPEGTVYAIVSPEFAIYQIENNGNQVLLTDSLPIDPLAITVSPSGDLYLSSAKGIFRIWYSKP